MRYNAHLLLTFIPPLEMIMETQASKTTSTSASSTLAPRFSQSSYQAVLAFGIFLFLYALNALFPPQSDDLGRGLGLLQGALSSYMNWNGRLGELLSVGFGSHFATTPYFALLNALIGTYVIYAFFFIVFGRKPSDTLQDLGTIALILFILMVDGSSSFGGIFIWPCGAFNYLWAYMLIFSFLIPYRILLSYTLGKRSTPPKLSFICGVGLFMLGILAGWSSEFIIVAIAFLLGLLVYMLYQKQQIPLWYIAGIAGLVVGFLIVFLSPGALKRIAVYRELGIPFYSFSELLALSFSEQIAWLKYVYHKANGFLTLAIILASALYLLESTFSKKQKLLFIVLLTIATLILRQHTSGAFFLLALVWAWYLSLLAHRQNKLPLRNMLLCIGFCFFAVFMYKSANIQMGWLPKRTSLPFTLLHIAMVLAFLHYLTSRYPHWRKPIATLGIASCIACGSFVLIAYVDMRIKWHTMLQSIATQKALGQVDIVVDSATFASYYKGYGDFGNPGEDPKVWPNNTYANYFGVESFTAKPMRP